jgi:DNA-binding response OmpR family regulator
MPKKIILIADDDDNIRNSLKDILELEGYTVYDADNGVTTLEIYERVHPDLMVLDIMMPELDGASLSFELNNRYRDKKIPIIFLSGVIARDGAPDNKKNENTVYLSKPFAISELLLQVRKSLGGVKIK